ncbi:MAG: DMT family transporter [Clostridia bacterium]|nr:DMT family transporter [Clostridia bacterium]
MKTKFKGPLCLFLCSLFWGMAFAAQSNAMNYMGPYTFVFLRSAITSLVLFSVHPLMVRTRMIPAENRENRASLWKVGALCGVFLVAATLLQQIGLVTTSTAKSGFITALYIVIVPILGLFIGKKPQITILLGVAMSLVGLYFLCMKDALRIDPGDLLTFFSAIVFALHILVIDRFGGNLDSVKLSAVQFLFAAVCSGILAFTLETPTFENFAACWTSVVYVAVFSGALGYTLQIAGQKSTDPTIASLIMCLESVFAAVGGWILLDQRLSGHEMLGCALMLGASIVALIPLPAKTKTA